MKNKGEGETRGHEAALTALVRLHGEYLRRNPNTPPVAKSGVVYEPNAGGTDVWRTIANMLHERHADAEDLCCWRAAELQLQGKTAKVGLRLEKGYWTCAVVTDDGVEDVETIVGRKSRRAK